MRGRGRKAAAMLALAAVFSTTVAATSMAATTAGDSPERIVITEQVTEQGQGRARIAILESESESWKNGELVWTWKPGADNDLGEFADSWGAPADAKLRHRGDQDYLLTNDGLGLAAVVPYPEGTPAYWAVDLGSQPNLHSIELLPDGNVAVAASRDNWIRIYTASQGPRSKKYAEFPLIGGHGVYWDASNDLLWALGNDFLVGLRVGGTPADPTLTEVRRHPLPTAEGHDLQPVASDPDRLWISTDRQVYQFSIESGEFRQDYPGAERISVPGVKAVGDDGSSGQVLTTFPKVGNPCEWCTDTVTLSRNNDAYMLNGAQFYKARWWVDPAVS